MSTAFDLKTYGTFSHIAPAMSDEEAFADTFDQAVTRPGSYEPFEAWCDWFGVNVVKVHTENDIGLGLLAHCPFFKAKEFRDDALYHVGCMLHGSEEAYLEFIQVAGQR